VGNIDKTISNDTLKKYFLDLYKSIISVKIIYDPIKNKSKGFGFVEFTNYKEFNKALNNKTPVFLGKQKLVFNSAKNRYDELEEINTLNNNNIIVHNDSYNSLTLTKQSSTTEIGNSISISNFNNSFLTYPKNSFEDNINQKPSFKKIYERYNEDYNFQYEISNAFKNILKMCQKVNFQYESKQCNYYCNINLYRNGNSMKKINSLKNNISINGNKNCVKSYFNKYEINYNT